MKIFGLGLSRTGTTTLNRVLNDLGFNTIHYPSSRKVLFSTNNDGANDIPVINYFEELDQKFPNSKFILTTRNKEKWLKSIVHYLGRKKDWKMSNWTIENRTKVYGSPFPDYEQCSKVYDNHEEKIRNYFKERPQDFLVLDICGGDNPKKLYEFLNVDHEPPESFPNENKLKK